MQGRNATTEPNHPIAAQECYMLYLFLCK